MTMNLFVTIVASLSLFRLGTDGMTGWLQSRHSRHDVVTASTLPSLRVRRCGTLLTKCRGGAEVNQDSCTDMSFDACSFEVVGAGGRMGSLLLQCPGAVAVPRGVSPGFRSAEGRPIVVVTPSQSWDEVYRQTSIERKSDLVWIGNGIPREYFFNATVVVPHYGVLQVGAPPTKTPDSPPTYVYGKHTAKIRSVLDNHGIRTEHVASWERLKVCAARKLLWASCMWLLCHSSDPPLTLSEVHRQKSHALERLLEELIPALQELTGIAKESDMNDTLAYFRQYSLSMPDAIPSKELAANELQERNGIWLSFVDDRHPQKFHEDFINNATGTEGLRRAKEPPPEKEFSSKEIRLSELGITLWGETREQSCSCKSAIIIGGGIIGSSIAMNLARRGVAVTVLDRLAENEMGATTPASWAWINANQKKPLAYQLLNQLGMLGWRRDAVLADFPLWNGALVQSKTTPDFPGGYTVEGPLTAERLLYLEPKSNFSMEGGPIHFFPDEGCVDPSRAVRALRHKTRKLGVTFVGGAYVKELLRKDDGRVVGALYTADTGTSESILADVVVVAAGVGSAVAALGGLPLCHSPGQVAFAQSSGRSALSRILVDTVRESHVLMRQDGTIVAGGGFLQVGGPVSSSSETSEAFRLAESDCGQQLLHHARDLAPEPVGSAVYTHFAQAVRPIPKDGWPAIGYIDSGLYVAVTHSGVTLAPIIGPCVAEEISDGVSLDLLRQYRPGRLFPHKYS